MKTRILPFPGDGLDGTVLKPIGPLAQTVANTSPGDMLLFMIALNRAGQLPPEPPSLGLTYSTLIRGFEDWFKANFKELMEAYNAEAQELFDTLEDFAVELWFEIKLA